MLKKRILLAILGIITFSNQSLQSGYRKKKEEQRKRLDQTTPEEKTKSLPEKLEQYPEPAFEKVEKEPLISKLIQRLEQLEFEFLKEKPNLDEILKEVNNIENQLEFTKDTKEKKEALDLIQEIRGKIEKLRKPPVLEQLQPIQQIQQPVVKLKEEEALKLAPLTKKDYRDLDNVFEKVWHIKKLTAALMRAPGSYGQNYAARIIKKELQQSKKELHDLVKKVLHLAEAEKENPQKAKRLMVELFWRVKDSQKTPKIKVKKRVKKADKNEEAKNLKQLQSLVPQFHKLFEIIKKETGPVKHKQKEMMLDLLKNIAKINVNLALSLALRFNDLYRKKTPLSKYEVEEEIYKEEVYEEEEKLYEKAKKREKREKEVILKLLPKIKEEVIPNPKNMADVYHQLQTFIAKAKKANPEQAIELEKKVKKYLNNQGPQAKGWEKESKTNQFFMLVSEFQIIIEKRKKE